MAASATEARVWAEGSLWWVQASGSGRTWATAATPVSGFFGYVREGMTITTGKDMVAIMERGRPDHWKTVGFQTIKVKVDFLLTGALPIPSTAAGTTVPMFHLEHRASAGEMGGTSGVYHQIMGVPIHSFQFSEKRDGNIYSTTLEGLAMIGPTGSGYIT